MSSFIVVIHEGRLPFFQRFPVKQRFGQAFAEGRMRYLSAEGRVRYLFAEGGDAHCYRGLGQSSEAQALTVNHRIV
jgi:hypothetical protein